MYIKVYAIYQLYIYISTTPLAYAFFSFSLI